MSVTLLFHYDDVLKSIRLRMGHVYALTIVPSHYIITHFSDVLFIILPNFL